MMKIDIMTIFPEMIDAVLTESIVGHAQGNGIIDINPVNIRDFADSKHHRTDDYPYGGGQGLLMLADPLFRCHQSLTHGKHIHTVLLSPLGKKFDQSKARKLACLDHLILVCGHYEGIDERFIQECVDEEISIGDFVLTGGEIPAMAIADSICRLLPGVLSDSTCFTDESYYGGLLEYPQYTRPEIWHDKRVPEVLLSGNHQAIKKWKRVQSLLRTLERRPDLLSPDDLSLDDKKLIEEYKKSTQ